MISNIVGCKKIRYLFLAIFSGFTSLTFGQVGIGTTSPDAVFDVTSTDSGILIPRLTSLERDAITAPVVGMMIFNSTENVFQFCASVSPSVIWKAVTNSPSLKYVGSIGSNSSDLSVSGNGAASRMPIFDFITWNDNDLLFTSITSGKTTLNVAEPGRYRITLNAYVSVSASGSAAIRYYVGSSRASGGAHVVNNPDTANPQNFSVNFSEIIEIDSAPAAITVRVDEVNPNTELILLASPISGVSVNNIQVEKLD
jgi:hypothetical protein